METSNHHRISRVTDKIVAASATVAFSDIYLAFLIFQSYICDVINLFIQKENGLKDILY
jgi:hypothetical protein